MGRKPTRWTNLPTGMRARVRGERIYYFLDTGGKPRKEIPLGTDYVLAVQKWGELTSSRRPAGGEYTFPDAVTEYRLKVMPGKAPRTQVDNEKELAWLLKFFGSPPAPLASIDPVHIRQYMDWRVEQATKQERKRRPDAQIANTFGQVRANREKALFSHIWNFARERGMTNLANPCAGIKGFKERGRDVLVSDDLLARIEEHAGAPLRFALRLAALTGQRPGDVLNMSEAHISEGMLYVTQGKTRAKLRIAVVGELAALVLEICAYKSQFPVRALSLLVNEEGQAMTRYMLRTRFDAARKAAGITPAQFQFRDLRAKAATDVDEATGTKGAQALLGHTTEGMTTHYVRHKAGRKVNPVR